MIFDSITNTEKYYSINKNFALAFRFLNQNNLNNLPIGKHDIHGNDCFALVNEYDTKPIKEAIWESHKNYIDIQYVVSGIEKMGFAPNIGFSTTQDYNQSSDCQLYSGEGNFVVVPQGFFAIFFPNDLHAPQLCVEEIAKVKKIVIKVIMC